MVERANDIAIVGMSCRMPGARDLDAFWALLTEGRDAVGVAPTDRPGIDEIAGFLDSATEFDAEFFGVPPNEARALDPQQLLGLELSWEALEDAGYPEAAGLRAGVFLGSTGTDFAELVAAQGKPGVGRHSLWAVGRGVLANRISNHYGFTGPSLVVDSGQSSSLLAVHLAVEALRSGECDVALAGGINLILSPLSGERIEQFGAHSPTGRCRTFDERADGIVRGEGGGLVVLKPLAAALADGDRVHAVIRGSSVNNGNERKVLSAPSADAQISVIRSALAAAEVAPESVQYVELHGTGTPAGDPVEAAALGDTYGSGRSAGGALAVGSVKTNIGHLEGAAGIAGLIKTVLCLRQCELVPSLHFRRPNPRIVLQDLGLDVVTERREWTETALRRAAVSAFGMGGTNVHVVLEQAPVVSAESSVESGERSGGATAVTDAGTATGDSIWLISARTEAALRAQAARLRDWSAAHPDADPADIAWSLAHTRTRLEWRGAVVGAGAGELRAGLDRLAGRIDGSGGYALDHDGSETTGLAVVSGRAAPRKVAFVFPGQGSQWRAMAAGLLATEPVFAAAVAECEAALAPFVEWSLTEVLRGESDLSDFERVDVVQPALFAMMVSLARLWRSRGVEPDVVVGHSQGEVAAAVVIGALSLSDGARVIALRSRAGAELLADRGGMAAVGLHPDAVRDMLLPFEDRLSLAAINGPTQTVVSGEIEAVQEFVGRCADRGVWARIVPAAWAGHSKLTEVVRERLLAELAPVRPRRSSIPFFSTVVADYLDTSTLDAEYWYRSLREPVRFAESVEALMRSDTTGFIEMSPHPVVAMAMGLTAESIGFADRVAILTTLERGHGEARHFRAAVARAVCAGIEVPADALGGSGGRIDLPTYAFDRRRWWSPDAASAAAAGDVSRAGLIRSDHPILAAAVSVAGRDEWLFTGRLTRAAHPWLAEFSASGSGVLSPAVLLELALATAGRVGAGAVAELRLETPLPEVANTVDVQVLVSAPDDGGLRRFTVSAATVDDGESVGPWVPFATGALAPKDGTQPQPVDGDWPPAAAEELAVSDLYDRLAARGLGYGPIWQGVTAAWQRGHEVYAEVSLESSPAEEIAPFGIHPALADALLHPAIDRLADGVDGAAEQSPVLPVAYTDIRLHGAAAAVRVRVERTDTATVRVSAFDEAGLPVLTIRSVSLRPVEIAGAPAAEVAAASAPRRRSVSAGPLAARVLAAPDAERDALVLAMVRDHAAGVVGHDSVDAIDPDQPFTDFGFDSLSGQQLRNRLVRAAGVDLPTTLVFDHPTPRAVMRLIRSRLEGTAPAAVRSARRSRSDEPIAIVGIGCRFPGAVGSAHQLWDLVAEGRDAISGFPADRGWDLERLFDPDPDKPGTVYSREGGFLTGAADFDAAFFGIGPREAAAMDPQQRLMLEVAWEALEDAGIDPAALRGTDTGVFVGASGSGYSRAVVGEYEGFRLTGTSQSVISGRVAYLLGLEGPAVTVDTACSSSLVALHLACQALRRGEASLVLAGGVSIAASPALFVDFARQRGLAADGRCKPFSAAADGVTWAEGVGVLAVQRLSDAQRAGHRVLAVIRGSAINQDGASNGLTAPNGPSQQRVIAAALADAGLQPADVDAVEAHGTGTALGDPIEAQALINAYGQDRAQPLRIGSIKSNIGHAVAAAGVGGVIKIVQALRHEMLPKSLHIDAPSPHVDWSAGAVELLTEPVAWPAGDRPRRAAVSSFGISGTNAHLILEEAPASADRATTDESVAPAAATDLVPLMISAKSAEALRAQAERLRQWLSDRPDPDLPSVAHSLYATRSQLPHRAVVLGTRRDDLLTALAEVAAAGEGPAIVSGRVHAGTTAFLFTGQGAQRAGMGAELARTFPAFAAALDRVCAEFDALLGISLRTVMFDDPDGVLDRTEFTQPALFAFQVALYRLVESFGVTPDVLIGHSIGELAAAHVAGVWSLSDACALVAARGRLMGALPPGGAMLAVAVDAVRAQTLLEGVGDRVSIAALNDPASTVLSGDTEAIAEIERRSAAEGMKTTRLRVSHAFHSARMDPMLDEFRSVAAGIDYQPPRVPLIATGTSESAADVTEPEYWVEQVRSTVRFAPGIEAAAASGVRNFLEIGPDAVLAALTRRCLSADLEAGCTVAAAARRATDEVTQVVTALAQLYTAGVSVQWQPLFDGRPLQRIPLPTYAFQHRRFWLQPRAAGAATDHPILTGVLPLAGSDEWLFTGRFSLRTHPWIADHMTYGVVVVPSATLIEFLLVAGERIGCGVVEELTLQAPILPAATADIELQVLVRAADPSGLRQFEFYFRSGADGEWVHNATGALAERWDGDSGLLTQLRAETWPPVDAEPIDPAWIPAQIARGSGLEYGPAFLGVRAAWHRDGTVFSEIALDTDAATDVRRHDLHPALLDLVMHSGLAQLAWRELDVDPDAGRLLFRWGGARLHKSAGEWPAEVTSLRVIAIATGAETVSVATVDPDGNPIVSVDAVVMRPYDVKEFRRTLVRDQAALYRLGWVDATARTDIGAPALALLGDTTIAGIDAQGSSPAELAAGPRPDVVVWRADTPGAAVTDEPAAVSERVRHALATLTAWLAEPALADSTLVVVVTGGSGRDGEAVAPVAAAVAGLVRSAQSEHPGRFVLVDQDPARPLDREQLDAVLRSGEPQVAVRDSAVLVPRLTRMDIESATPAPHFDDETVLVTGGTGGLGALVARHLVEVHGVRRLVLTSRRGATAPGAAELAGDLERAGAQVRVVACDVADAAAVRDVVAELGTGPIAIVHAAGVLDDGTVQNLTAEQVDRVLAPKVRGAWNLHEATRDRAVSAFVVFSSVAALLGSSGQGNYAAGNGYLDALMVRRRAAGLPGIALAWGPWHQGSGMTGGLNRAALARWDRMGLGQLGDEEGLRLFDAALAAGHPAVAPLRFDPTALRRESDDAAVPAVLRGFLPRTPAAAERPQASAAGALSARLAEVPPARHGEVVLDVVLAQAAAVLGHDSPDDIRPDQRFDEIGFDSLGGVEFRNRLAEATGLQLPSTLVFDHPTVAAVAALIRSRVAPAPATAPAKQVARRKRTDEPIAIVGMSCRLPGAASPEELWRLLAAGTDATGDFPSDRGWDLERLIDPDPDKPGTVYTGRGGFLTGAAEFDAGFFGIGPSEAAAMDPQQRLLLEAVWEAFEDAGIDPNSLRGSDTGVFAGACYSGYFDRVTGELEGYRLTGTTHSVISGRVSYVFGLEGPAVTVDTACSSSLVALHQACGALRQGETSLALASGVTVAASPYLYVDFARQRGLSPDGRCKSFAATADGVAFSEGVGVLVLERLSDARRLGHRVLAVVRGTAVNQDGASNGLTAPNGPSQERVIAAALADAGLAPSDVDAVEAHGTGTTLGDPIEAQALINAYGADRSRPLRIGSIKSNIGHTVAAAGVAGVIKMVQALRHEMLPKSLHLDSPTPHVDWSAGTVELLSQAQPWPSGGRVRRAGVSSFGVSGTNAHAVIEEAPAEVAAPVAAAVRPEPLAWLLSANSLAGLRAQAQRLRQWVRDDPDLDVRDLAHALVATRARLDRRAAVVGYGRDDLLTGLADVAAGAPGVLEGSVGTGKTAFLFTGQGAQRSGMGARMYREFPVFATAFDEVCEHIDQLLGRPLREVMVEPDHAELLDRTEYTQPALFAFEVATYRLLESFGLTPDMLIGHSIGELSAAHVAGVWSLADACALVVARGRLMGALPPGGAMLAAAIDEEGAQAALAGYAGRVSLAAVNGPVSVVMSGAATAIDELAEEFTRRGVRISRLRVSHAFHSALMEPMLDEFRTVAAGLSYHEPRVPMVAGVTGRQAGAEILDPEYWVDQVRACVRFAHGIATAVDLGARRFVELGPDSALTAMVRECLAETPVEARVTTVATARRGTAEPTRFLSALAGLDVVGTPVDWPALFAERPVRRVALPTYVFRHERYWLQPSVPADVRRSGLDEAAHPLLGATVRIPDSSDVVFTGRLSREDQQWLADHTVGGVTLLPGAAFVDLIGHIGASLDCPRVVELVIEAPLSVPATGGVELRVVATGPDEAGARTVSVYSRDPAADRDAARGDSHSSEWVRHVLATIAELAEPHPAPATGVDVTWPPADAVAMPLADAYAELSAQGYDYGPAFQGLTALWRRGGEVFAELALPSAGRVAGARFGVHPVLLDAALHALLVAGQAPGSGSGLVVPFSWEDVVFHAVAGDTLRVRAAVSDSAPDRIALSLMASDGTPVLEVGALTLRALTAPASRAGGLGYAVDWVAIDPQPVPDVIWSPAEGHETVTVGSRRAVVVRIDTRPGDDVPASARDVLTATTTRVQELLAQDRDLVVVTSRAAAIHAGESVDPAAASIWGLVRTAQSEYPDRVRIVDVEFQDGYRDAAVVALAGDEPQLALRGSAAFVPRLRSGANAEHAPLAGAELLGTSGPHQEWALTLLDKGTLTADNFGLRPDPASPAPLAPGQVRVRMRAVGLNFRDVLVALGTYPDPTAGIGGEGAGVVTEVAADVTEFAPGDRVFGFVTGVGSLAVTDHRLLAPMPADWTFAQAAAVPVVYATAYYGLVDLAGARAGQTLLLHAATGGVGTAAVQLARHMGLRLLVTASRAKWNALRDMGFGDTQIADSRTLEFEEKFRAQTGGAGVDIVLDSLAGEFVDASLRLLPRGGRFVEMGMIDRRDPDEVAAAHPGVHYHGFMLMDVAPDRLQQILRSLVELFAAGTLTHSPLTAWDLQRAPQAFRHLSQARHVGKNVLTLPAPWNPEGTVLITGGTGGLGVVAARHLVTTYGVRRLLLASRRGAAAPDADRVLAELTALGATVDIVACDAADPDAVRALLAAIPARHPLTAVVHTAGVLSDGVLSALTPERLATVLRPKVDAAWHLHEATSRLDLAAFVLYSSIAGVIGSAGQANYAAANVFSDALAQYRQVRGLPATSLAWGPWRDSTGMTEALSAADLARWQREGFVPLAAAEAMAMFDAALVAGRAQFVAARIDRNALAAVDEYQLRPVLRGLSGPARPRGGQGTATANVTARLAGLTPAEQTDVIVEVIREQAAAVLGLDTADEVEPQRPFSRTGFDSLGVMEFRNRLKTAVGVQVPATAMFDHPTPVALADYLRTQLAPVDRTGERLTAEVEALARACAAAELDADQRAALAERLRALSRELDDGAADADDPLDAADDRELFDFIDNLS
ncbi:SDR family NAD(P)-dependent oxidoreductase [Nocardia africana]|uniref:SDR family NAD(P)-dependent oxidoreductase n=1 Tax=Nocardia africana TaxID=134964 RepID=A0ABW6NTE2_9NOCA